MAFSCVAIAHRLLEIPSFCNLESTLRVIPNLTFGARDDVVRTLSSAGY